jgi:D-2-hydroxyacid dehydrogenase (NADP+)
MIEGWGTRMAVELLVVEQETQHEFDHWKQALSDLPGVAVHFGQDSADLIPVAGNAVAILAKAHSISADLVRATPGLRWIGALTTGIDHLLTLDLPPDIVITNARGIHGPQMSELAFMYMLALTRDIRGVFANQAKHVWARRGQIVLHGKSVLIVGVGAISEALAQRCQAFGMHVVGISDARQSCPGFDSLHPRRDLLAQASQADYLVALVPYTPETHHMISADILAALKPSAIFVNIARGKVVDEAALIEALRTHRIAGAGLDVFSEEPLQPASPLWDMENVIITPRIGGMSDTYARQLEPLVKENLRHFLSGDLASMRNIV